MQGRYADVWTDTVRAENEIRERRRLEQSYRHMLALTDDLLGRLERLNLAGRRELDPTTRRAIAATLLELTPAVRQRFPVARTVQEALDGTFEVQEQLLLTLQRMLHWDRLVAMPWEAEVAGGDERAIRRSA